MKAKTTKKRLRRSTLISQDDESSPCRCRGSSSKCGYYVKKSEFERDLIHRAAERGIAAKKANDGRMPDGWYPAEVKKLKSHPGCEILNITTEDLRNKVKALLKSARKNAGSTATKKLRSTLGDAALDMISFLCP